MVEHVWFDSLFGYAKVDVESGTIEVPNEHFTPTQLRKLASEVTKYLEKRKKEKLLEGDNES